MYISSPLTRFIPALFIAATLTGPVVAQRAPPMRDRDVGAGPIEVTDRTSLNAAILAAPPGSTIRLAPGEYKDINVCRKIDGAPVAITGPRDARFIRLTFTNPASGWRVQGITILAGVPGVGPYGGQAVHFARASDIAMDDVLITGVAPGPDAWNEGSKGILFSRAEAIAIANSEIRHVRLIAALQDSRGIVIANNRFIDAREGLQVSNVQGLVIRNNLFRGWVPRFDRKEHPDMIQFWTRGRPTGSARVEISNNLLDAGDDRAVQGIFTRAEDFEYGKAPQGFHRDWVIRNNIYFGSSKHGISLSDVQGVLVENNSVLASPHAFVGRQPVSADGRSGTGYKPFILLLRSTQAQVRNNLAAFIASTAEPGPVVQSNNQQYKPGAPKSALNPDRSFMAPLLAGPHEPSDFALASGSQAQRKGRGADAAKVGPRGQAEPIELLATRARTLADTADAFMQGGTSPAGPGTRR
jgi:hypothetical protein